MSEFEKTVRKALIDADMTMSDLASEIGISVSYVCELLKGTRRNENQIAKICEVLGIEQTIS